MTWYLITKYTRFCFGRFCFLIYTRFFSFAPYCKTNVVWQVCLRHRVYLVLKNNKQSPKKLKKTIRGFGLWPSIRVCFCLYVCVYCVYIHVYDHVWVYVQIVHMYVHCNVYIICFFKNKIFESFYISFKFYNFRNNNAKSDIM